MRRSLRVCLLVAAVALAVVTVWVGSAQALSFQSSYNATTGDMTVTLKGDSFTQWNDLEIQIRHDDEASAFSTSTPSWSVDSKVTIAQKTYVRLTRSSITNADETIVVTGPTHRSGRGEIRLTLDNTIVSTKSGQTYMNFSGDGPGLGPWGVALLVLLLLGAGSFLVLRSRTRMAAA